MAEHGHAHGGDHAHGHVDPAGDKAAAFIGLAGGMVVIGALLYGMVQFTNSRYAHEGGEKTAAESTR